ncbi:Phosphatidylserine decarboxylase proenzyme, mitochondrial [Dirofilaria immitis]|nr:Phosphatidylserine decarboxylase proenzyme, mitochondrial [Dirofilaria immitis]
MLQHVMLVQRWFIIDARKFLQRKWTNFRDYAPVSQNYCRQTKSSYGNAICWSIGFVTGSSTIYLYNLFIPDSRELEDKRQYYSDWKCERSFKCHIVLTEEIQVANEDDIFTLRAYSSLPLNAISRFAGGIANVYIPVWLRPKIFNVYIRAYDCRMDEAEVSPADGIVIHYGKVNEGRIEFQGHELYQMVLYLAPGNYHGFHAPAKWMACEEIHFPGLLLSVRPTFLHRMPHLFCINERVVLKGYWKHGFFAMSAVAATNVGDVSIDADPLLHTNIKRLRKEMFKTQPVTTELEHAYQPGDKVGEFRLGSTIVLFMYYQATDSFAMDCLIFEAPPTIQFAVNAGDNLRYGQSLIISDVHIFLNACFWILTIHDVKRTNVERSTIGIVTLRDECVE